MSSHLFFYEAVWILDFAGLALFALMTAECVTEGASPFFRSAASPLVYVFLLAAGVHICVWLLKGAGVTNVEDMYEHFKFVNTRVPPYWLEVGTVFAPLLLWIPSLREQPRAVLGVAAVTIAPWISTLLGHYFGLQF